MTWDDWAQVADRPYPGSPAFARPTALTGGKAYCGRVRAGQPPRGPDPPGPGAKSEGPPEDMCGIVGLRLKDPALHPGLGKLGGPLLEVLASPGRGSRGWSVYRRIAGP